MFSFLYAILMDPIRPKKKTPIELLGIQERRRQKWITTPAVIGRCDLPWRATKVEVCRQFVHKRVSPELLKIFCTPVDSILSPSAVMRIFLFSLITFGVFSASEAQYKLLDTSAADKSPALLEIRVLSPSPPPRTRKIHSSPGGKINVVRIYSGLNSDLQSTSKPATTNSKNGKYRGYRSKCRCEKIWKCQKMQISIARCPHDHFMCCS